MPFKTQILLFDNSGGVIGVLYVACAESKAVEGTEKVPPTGKLQEGQIQNQAP